MTATNHALTGSVIALAVGEPILALPLAFLSHFVCDMLPHFGAPSYESRIKNKSFHHRVYLLDLVLLISVIILLFALGAGWYVYVALALAVSPDFVWFYRYFFKEKMGQTPPTKGNILTQFHRNIQKKESIHPGALIEFSYALLALIILVNLA